MQVFIDFDAFKKQVNAALSANAANICRVLPDMNFCLYKGRYCSPLGFGGRTPQHSRRDKVVFRNDYTPPRLIENGNAETLAVIDYVAFFVFGYTLGVSWSAEQMAALCKYFADALGLLLPDNVPTATGTPQHRAPMPTQQPIELPFFAYGYRPKFNTENTFCRNVLAAVGGFGGSDIEKVCQQYHIESKGAKACFWRIDTDNTPRACKLIEFDSTGHRNKTKQIVSHPDSKELQGTHRTRPTFFGEHLLKQHPDKPVCIVESEKTAVICALLKPHYVWLATGGISNSAMFGNECLQGRHVTLYPDADACQTWQQKVIDKDLPFAVNDICGRFVEQTKAYKEQHPNEQTEIEQAFGESWQKIDIADVFLWQQQRPNNTPQATGMRPQPFICPNDTPPQTDLPTPEQQTKIEQAYSLTNYNSHLYNVMLSNPVVADLVLTFNACVCNE